MDDRISEFINANFFPVKVHVKEQPAGFARFGVQWTPTLVVLDPHGEERYRFEGYFPPEDFLAQLELGLAKSDFAHNRWDEAQRRFRAIVEQHPEAAAAPEALYWAGVSEYKGNGQAAALEATARAFSGRYQQSEWARKASVWAPAARKAG